MDQYWSSLKFYFFEVMEVCIPNAVVKVKRDLQTGTSRKPYESEIHCIMKWSEVVVHLLTMLNTTQCEIVVCLLRESKKKTFYKLKQIQRNFGKQSFLTMTTLTTCTAGRIHSSIDKANTIASFTVVLITTVPHCQSALQSLDWIPKTVFTIIYRRVDVWIIDYSRCTVFARI